MIKYNQSTNKLHQQIWSHQSKMLKSKNKPIKIIIRLHIVFLTEEMVKLILYNILTSKQLKNTRTHIGLEKIIIEHNRIRIRNNSLTLRGFQTPNNAFETTLFRIFLYSLQFSHTQIASGGLEKCVGG